MEHDPYDPYNHTPPMRSSRPGPVAPTLDAIALAISDMRNRVTDLHDSIISLDHKSRRIENHLIQTDAELLRQASSARRLEAIVEHVKTDIKSINDASSAFFKTLAVGAENRIAAQYWSAFKIIGTLIVAFGSLLAAAYFVLQHMGYIR